MNIRRTSVAILMAFGLVFVLMSSCKKSDTGVSFTLTYQLKFDGTLINAPAGGTPQAQYTYTGFQPTTEGMSSGISTWSKSLAVNNAPHGTTFTLSTPSAVYFATSSSSPTLKAEIGINGFVQAENTTTGTLYSPNIGTGTVSVTYVVP